MKDEELEQLKAVAKKKMESLRESHWEMLRRATEVGPDMEPPGPLAGPIKKSK